MKGRCQSRRLIHAHKSREIIFRQGSRRKNRQDPQQAFAVVKLGVNRQLRYQMLAGLKRGDFKKKVNPAIVADQVREIVVRESKGNICRNRPGGSRQTSGKSLDVLPVRKTKPAWSIAYAGNSAVGPIDLAQDGKKPLKRFAGLTISDSAFKELDAGVRHCRADARMETRRQAFARRPLLLIAAPAGSPGQGDFASERDLAFMGDAPIATALDRLKIEGSSEAVAIGEGDCAVPHVGRE